MVNDMSISRKTLVLMGMMCALCLSACDSNKTQKDPPPSTDMTQDDMSDMSPDADMDVIVRPVGPMAGTTPARLLTRYEYDNTVSDLFGQSFQLTKTLSFPSENLVGWFENDAWSHKVSPLLINKYTEASEVVTEQLLKDKGTLLGCDLNTTAEQACVDAFLPKLVERAFRRPVTNEEIQHVRDIYAKQLASESDPDSALAIAIQSVLQSPQFLYRLELGEPSADAQPPQDGGMTQSDFELIGSYEMASRLSYFLWASMPDQTLIELAQKGELSTPEQIEAQVERMLQDDRAKRMVRQFHRQWLTLKKLESVVKAKNYYPKWKDSIRDDWRISLERFIDYAFWEEGTFEAFMTSNVVFMTNDMAQMYNVEIPADSGGVFKYVAPVNERFGIMTQPGLMGMLGNSNQSSPILRGIFMREHLLCQVIPPPPNDQEIEPPDPDPNATTREIFAIHTANEQCAGCHNLIDPVGFGFENYDGVGHFRTMENNFPIDSSGALTASPDPTLNGPFDNARELAMRLAGSDVVQSCMTNQWFQFALGRNHDKSDAPSLEGVKAKFKASGYKWDALFKAIATSDSFRYRRKIQEK